MTYLLYERGYVKYFRLRKTEMTSELDLRLSGVDAQVQPWCENNPKMQRTSECCKQKQGLIGSYGLSPFSRKRQRFQPGSFSGEQPFAPTRELHNHLKLSSRKACPGERPFCHPVMGLHGISHSRTASRLITKPRWSL